MPDFWELKEEELETFYREMEDYTIYCALEALSKREKGENNG